MTTDSSIATQDAASRLATIQDEIAKAARLTGRTADAITLIAISKTKDAAAIQPLIDAGQRVFGENRVQEAQEKWPVLRQAHPDIRLHLVGQLQSNKAADAVALFDVIHSLDRPSLLSALAKAMDAQGKRVPCYVQVNIGAEPQKGGCAIADTPALIAAARAADVEPAPYFALLAKMAREESLPRLSMGMSSDYETAIMLGATDIRVGTALFGDRPPPARPVPRSGLGMLRNSPGA